jgi:hypothetical protein
MPVLVFEWGKESRIVKRQLKTGKKEVSWGLNLAKKKGKIEDRLWFFWSPLAIYDPFVIWR